MSEAPSLVDHTTKNIVTYGPAIGAIYAAAHVCYLAIKRLLKVRRRKHERQEALEEAVRVMLDVARSILNPRQSEKDAEDELAKRAVFYEKVRDARQKLWLAQGRKLSAPSRAPTDESAEDT